MSIENDTATIGDDLMSGVPAIATECNWTESKTYHMLQTGKIPGFKIGKIWHLRKSRLKRHLDELEEASTC